MSTLYDDYDDALTMGLYPDETDDPSMLEAFRHFHQSNPFVVRELVEALDDSLEATVDSFFDHSPWDLEDELDLSPSEAHRVHHEYCNMVLAKALQVILERSS